jgi:predicted CoA-binding protein
MEEQPGRRNSPEAIARGLAGRTIAMVGLSSRPESPSYEVAQYLREHGYRVIPINPRETEVLGERAYPSLREAPAGIDVVDVFRKPDAVPAVVDDAIAIGAPLLWLQLGVVNEEAAARAESAGMTVIMDRCMHIEHLKRARTTR